MYNTYKIYCCCQKDYALYSVVHVLYILLYVQVVHTCAHIYIYILRYDMMACSTEERHDGHARVARLDIPTVSGRETQEWQVYKL